MSHGRKQLVGLVVALVVMAADLGSGAARVEAAEGIAPPAPFPTWEAFVDTQYVDFRVDVPGGLDDDHDAYAAWAGSLASGAKQPGDLIAELRGSSDNVTNVDSVARLYRAYLGRIPDVSGLRYWVYKRRFGVEPYQYFGDEWTLQRISDSFAGSSEFKTKYGALTNRQFVSRIYTDVLGRAAETGGLNYWTGQLDKKKKTRGQVMIGFSESNEYRRKQAEPTDAVVSYTSMLGRAPTTSELDAWVARQRAGTTLSVLAGELLASPAYAARRGTGAPLEGLAIVRTSGGVLCTATTSGPLSCRGNNLAGELGDGAKESRLQARAVSGVGSVLDMATNGSHSCAVLANGTVKCWGANEGGQLGDGTTTQRVTPVQVAGLSGATKVAVGSYGHSCALLTGGTVRCWGANEYGELGDGSRTPRVRPVTVSGLTGAVDIEAGGYSSCALLGSGGVKCWGNNSAAQLGDGTQTLRARPVSVSGITNATSLDVGAEHSCVRLQTGRVRCWGWGQRGQTGPTADLPQLTPKEVPGITDAVEAAAGARHSCALRSGGTVVCWGDNLSGQIGTPISGSSIVSQPTTVPGVTGATTIETSGSSTTCAIVAGGIAMCWGSNDYGNAGNWSTREAVPATALLG